MKKIIKLLSITFLFTILLSGCGKKNENTLTIGVSPKPHKELIELIKDDLKAEGVDLNIVEFTDYLKPNLALAEKEIDLNFFQHEQFLNEFKEQKNLNIESIGKIHVEPMGLYSKKINDLKDLKSKSEIAIPNDVTNGGRALLLLEKEGLIKLDPKKGILATENDIIENPKNIKIIPLEAASLPRVVNDLDGAIINGNYAIEAGFNVKDSIISEDKSSPYANIIAIRTEDKNNENIKKFMNILQSDKVKNYINDNFNGAIIPAF